MHKAGQSTRLTKSTTFRFTEDEFHRLTRDHTNYPTDVSKHGFYKDIILGNRIHPNFEDPENPGIFPLHLQPLFRQSSYSDQWLRHYLCMIIASQIMMIENDPTVSTAIHKDMDRFLQLTNMMREYTFDDDGNLNRLTMEELGMIRK